MILDTILNSEIDVFMSKWNEAFLPASLREIMLKADNNGEPLISDSKVLMEFDKRTKYQETGYEIFLFLFGIIIIAEVLFMNFAIFAPVRRFTIRLIFYFLGNMVRSTWFSFSNNLVSIRSCDFKA